MKKMNPQNDKFSDLYHIKATVFELMEKSV